MSYTNEQSIAWRTEVCESHGEGLLFLVEPHFDKAFIGVSYEGLVTYDAQKIVDALMEANGWIAEDAHEYADFNIFNSYGDLSPIYIWPFNRHPELTTH